MIVMQGASLAAHALAVAAIIYFMPMAARSPDDLIPVSLLTVGDGSGGSAGNPGSHTAVPTTMTREIPRRRVARRAPAPVPPAPIVSAVSASLVPDPVAYRPSELDGEAQDGAIGAQSGMGSSLGVGGSGAGGRGGSGNGGGGDVVAYADYGANPIPPYPALARRRSHEGTVTLRVVVGADGAVRKAEVAESSGFEELDQSALDTVRTRWRFVPARRGGVAVDSSVLVPVKFSLNDS